MKRLSLLFLTLAIVGCAPPYIAELNLAAPLAQQMTRIAALGPYYTSGSTTGMKFLPVKPTAATIDALNVQSGFLVSRTPGVESLTFVSLSPGGNMQSSGGQTFSLAGADPNYPYYEYDVLATSATANILVFHLGDATSPGNNTYQLFTAGLPNGSLQSSTVPQVYTSLFGAGSVYAAQVFPLPAAPFDQFNFLYNYTGINGEGTAIFASPIFSTGTITNSSVPPLPGAGYRVLYYQNGQSGALSLSYASYYTAGNWVCYRWSTGAPTPLLVPGITHPINALLTTGDLISTDGGTLRVYDSNGSQKTSAPLGAMQFCYEAYVGATPYVFFSVSMDLSRDGWAFQVFAIPTASMRGLHG